GSLPVLEGSIGWYSVYGHVLATACILAVLVGITRVDPDQPPRAAVLLGWGLLLCVASTSFGIGLGVAIGMPVIAFLLVPAGRARRRLLTVFAAVAVAMPLAYFGAQHLS